MIYVLYRRLPFEAPSIKEKQNKRVNDYIVVVICLFLTIKGS